MNDYPSHWPVGPGIQPEPCRCGADDCRKCHPENYDSKGRYLTCDPNDFWLVDDGTLDTVIAGPHSFETRYDIETAADYRNTYGELDTERFVKEVVLDQDDFADYMADLD